MVSLMRRLFKDGPGSLCTFGISKSTSDGNQRQDRNSQSRSTNANRNGGNLIHRGIDSMPQDLDQQSFGSGKNILPMTNLSPRREDYQVHVSMVPSHASADPVQDDIIRVRSEFRVDSHDAV